MTEAGVIEGEAERIYWDRQSGRARVKRNGKLVYRYRAVMEEHLGRPLAADEQVHHLNGDQADDRLENLLLLDRRTHGVIHGFESGFARRRRRKFAWSEEHECCVDCGTTDKKHVAHGLCRRCDARHRMRRYRAERKAAA